MPNTHRYVVRMYRKCTLSIAHGARARAHAHHAHDSLDDPALIMLHLKVSGEKEFFAQVVVDAVSKLDPQTLDLKMIGIKKVTGGGLRDSFLVDGESPLQLAAQAKLPGMLSTAHPAGAHPASQRGCSPESPCAGWSVHLGTYATKALRLCANVCSCVLVC